MSRIDKLTISGARSFSPNYKEVIQFGSPLTLIVGYNGSGKTTIIECLKYATTGELPPNSKGGAFVHEPRLAGEKEVLAQVKLTFRSATGVPHVVTRSMQLTLQRAQRKFKTLEGSLVQVANGERTQVSLRNAKLDELVPYTLGVAPAILDSVIFCHQDESLWPMSEPAALKKRFDEIFQATKWTKAIETLKVIRKRHNEQLAIFKVTEAHDKADKVKAKRCSDRMQELQEELENDRTSLAAVTENITKSRAEADGLRNEVALYKSLMTEIGTIETSLGYLRDQRDQLKQTMREIPGMERDEQLLEALAQYDKHMAALEQQEKETRRQKQEVEERLIAMREEQTNLTLRRGQLQSRRERYERQVSTRAQLIQSFAATHGLRGFDETITSTEMAEAKMASFSQKIQKLHDDKLRELARVRERTNTEKNQAGDDLMALEGKKAARQQDRIAAKAAIEKAEKMIIAIQAELAGYVDMDEGKKALLDVDYLNATNDLQQAQQEDETANWPTVIADADAELGRVENEGTALTNEFIAYVDMSKERAQIEVHRESYTENKAKLDALVRTYKPELDKLLGENWAPGTVEKKFTELAKEQGEAVKKARDARAAIQSTRHQASMRLDHAREAIKERMQGVDENRQRVAAVLVEVQGGEINDVGVDDYPDELNATESELQSLKEDLSLFDALADYYNKCQKYLESKSRCLLCEHSFDAKEEQPSRKRLEKKIEKHLDPQKKAQVQRDHDQAAARRRSLADVRVHYDTYVRLTGELLALEAERDAREKEFDATAHELEDHDVIVDTQETAMAQIDMLGKSVSAISEYNQKVTKVSESIKQIEKRDDVWAKSRSVDEIKAAQAANTDEKTAANKRVEEVRAKQAKSRDRVRDSKLAVSTLGHKLAQATALLETKKRQMAEVQTYRTEMQTQRSAMEKVGAAIKTIESELVAARRVRDDVLAQGWKREQIASDAADAVKGSIDELNTKTREIEEYVREGIEKTLARCIEETGHLAQAVADKERDLGTISTKAEELHKEIEAGERKRREIRDCLDHRRAVREIAAHEQHLAELIAQRDGVDIDALATAHRRADNAATRTVAERSRLVGIMHQKDQELGRLIEDWNRDYHNAEQRHRKSFIQVQVTQAALDDLGQYAAALDKAIMQYHAIKMDEINRIAAELWQATYQGTDIDTIMLRSDAEVVLPGSSSAAPTKATAPPPPGGKKTYNYRLCMVKQDTEMDMRGRCSAGQKVLASIIIRLALAETFGLRCGLIALDEPTTNLDSDNIKSLAESLHNIIAARRSQANLQLIVITHDEEFLRHMRCSDFCDGFFRVRRNQLQHSVIEKESIARVM